MKRFLTKVLAICTVMSLMPVSSVKAEEADDGTLRILFTEDLHDQLESMRALDEEGNQKWYGGYAYLKRAIDYYRTDTTVVVDAGDFSTGNLYSSLFETNAPDLTLMHEMGYDAVALGEGEFQYGPDALGTMLSVPEEVPNLLCSNLEAEGSELKSVWEERGAASVLLNKNDVKVGVFSLMNTAYEGKDSGYALSNAEECAKEMVSDLKASGAEVIICLSHLCTNTDPDADRVLAEHVDGIDVIVSGHTYEAASEPEKVNDTLIVYTDTNGRHIGVLDLDVKTGEVVEYKASELCTSEWNSNEDIKSMVSDYSKRVNIGTLLNTKFTTSSVLAHLSYTFNDVKTDENAFYESNTADLITDAYVEFYKEHLSEIKRKAAEAAAKAAAEKEDAEEIEEEEEDDVDTFSKEGILLLLEEAKQSWIEVLNGALTSGDPVISEKPVAVVGRSEIRDTFREGNVTTADVYRVLSAGTQGGAEAGESALVIAYMSGYDLRMLCELDLTLGRTNPDDQFYFGELEYDYNDKRSDFNKVTEVRYRAATDYYVPVSRRTYYPVLMSMDLVKKIPGMFKKAGTDITVTFCRADGKKASSSSLLIATDQNNDAVSQWKTVASYIAGFRGSGSVGAFDDEYKTPRTQKTDATSMSLKALLKNTADQAWLSHGEKALKVAGVLILIRIISALLRRSSLKKQID